VAKQVAEIQFIQKLICLVFGWLAQKRRGKKERRRDSLQLVELSIGRADFQFQFHFYLYFYSFLLVFLPPFLLPLAILIPPPLPPKLSFSRNNLGRKTGAKPRQCPAGKK